MARTAVSVQEAPAAGLADVVFTAAIADGHMFDNNRAERLLLLVKNDDASGKTITLQTPGTKDGLAVDDRELTVAAGDIAAIPSRRYYTQSDGRAWIDYSAITNLAIAVVEVKP